MELPGDSLLPAEMAGPSQWVVAVPDRKECPEELPFPAEADRNPVPEALLLVVPIQEKCPKR